MGARAGVILALLLGTALGPGCGRADLYPPNGRLDGGLEVVSDRRPDSGHDVGLPIDQRSPPLDMAVDRPADIRADIPADVPVDLRADLPTDARPDVPDGGADCGPLNDPRHCGSCGHDCTQLPNVDPSSIVCSSGDCLVVACADGFSQCPLPLPNQGCLTDLVRDPNNCGSCGMTCDGLGGPALCRNRTCVLDCPFGYADCTPEPGCETMLGDARNCGGCGRPTCDLANLDVQCYEQDDWTCAHAICAPGYGNCDIYSADCEATYGAASGAGCLPKYRGVRAIAINQFYPDGTLAVTPGGSQLIGGAFQGTVDFDPTDGVDSRDALAPSLFVTKLNPDGSYAWTATFVSSIDAIFGGVTPTADGGILVTGGNQGIVDLDPGPGTDYHASESIEPFIVKLAGDGTWLWSRTLPASGTPGDSAGYGQAVLSASDGSIYVAGQFGGPLDFDPGPGVEQRDGGALATFLLKLTAGLDFAWVQVWDTTSTRDCSLASSQFALSPDGTVWSVGYFQNACDFEPGPGVDVRQPQGTGTDGFVMAVGPDGRSKSVWTFGDADFANGAQAIAIDAQGSIFIAGTFAGSVDLDPGPGDMTLTAPVSGAAFVLQLGPTGALQWVQSLHDITIAALALAPDGSVIAGGYSSANNGHATVIAVRKDQPRIWSLGFGGAYASLRGLGITPMGFVVAGQEVEGGDVDPGTGEDLVAAGSVYAARYDF